MTYKIYKDPSKNKEGSLLQRMNKSFATTKKYELLKDKNGKTVIETDQFIRL